MKLTSLKKQEEYLENGVPVCGGNLSTPVIDQAQYIKQVRYAIGNVLYIENAD